ncbi:MAG: DUF3857 domain-containing protein [Candidatus Acidiferrales bacterium]|jgi:hypothetical protein
MSRTARIIFSLFILVLVSLISPHFLRATDWQPISPEDLALKDNPKQPGADAMILYRELVDDASKAPTSGDTVEEYVRIKIFTQEGTKYGHVEIPFSKTYQNVVYVAGRTIKPDGSIVKFDGQVLETTVEKSSGVKILAKAFTLPDVQPGCIIEYKYQMQGQAGWVHSHEWSVSQPMYTREAHFTYVPDTSYGNGLHPMYRTYLLPADAALKEQVNGTYLMAVHDIPGVVPEPLMPPERPIQARVDFYYQNPDAPSAADPSDNYWNHYAKKWDGELEHFIDKKNALNQELSKIVNPNDAPELKLRKIYARVQQIRNLNLEDFKMQKEMKDENLKENSNVEDVLSRGYAYGTQINYLFVGLARAAGFDATEVYIAPRNTELFIPARNDATQLSDEIVWVRAGSQEYYLDPAARYFPFGLLPWYETETGGFRVDKHGATAANTPAPVSSDATIIRNADLEMKEDGSVAGTIQVDFTGQRAALIRETRRKDDDTARIKYFEDDIKTWLPVGSTFEVNKIANWDDTSQPVHVEGTLEIPSLASNSARRMLMPLEIFQPSQMNSFAAEKRVNAVYLYYPYEEIDDIKLRVPAGYKAETLPPERKVDLGAVTYDISAVAQDSGVEVKRHLVMKGIIFSKDDYPALRRFFGSVKTNDNAQMVLQNAQSAQN